MFVELMVFDGVAYFAVENWNCPFCEGYDGVGAAGSGFGSAKAHKAIVPRTCVRRDVS